MCPSSQRRLAAEIYETFFRAKRAPGFAPPVRCSFPADLSAFARTSLCSTTAPYRGEWNYAELAPVRRRSKKTWSSATSEAKPTVAVGMNRSVYYGAYHEQRQPSKASNSDDFVRWIKRLKQTEGTSAFASGDVHFSEVMDIEAEQNSVPDV